MKIPALLQYQKKSQELAGHYLFLMENITPAVTSGALRLPVTIDRNGA